MTNLDDLRVVAFFLVHAERDQPSMMYGSWTIAEAVTAMASLMEIPVEKLRSLAD